jgi:hypothetical protein
MASDIRKRKKRRLKTVVKKFNSFEEAEKAEIEYWRNLSGEEKLKVLDEIQMMHLRALYPRGKKFEKVVRFVKLGEE